MNKWIECVAEFHRKFGRPVNVGPRYLPPRDCDLRASLVKEESTETLDAIESNYLIGIADGIVDTIYVLIGTALEYGIDLDPIFDEVHRTNMLKDGGKLRADGKIMKPAGWQPPRIAELIKQQQDEANNGSNE